MKTLAPKYPHLKIVERSRNPTPILWLVGRSRRVSLPQPNLQYYLLKIPGFSSL